MKIILFLALLLQTSLVYAFDAKQFIGLDDVRKIPGVKRLSSFLHNFPSKYGSSLGLLNGEYFITIEENLAYGQRKASWSILFAKKIPSLKKNEDYATGICEIDGLPDHTIFAIINQNVQSEYVKAIRAWRIIQSPPGIKEIHGEIKCENASYMLHE